MMAGKRLLKSATCCTMIATLLVLIVCGCSSKSGLSSDTELYYRLMIAAVVIEDETHMVVSSYSEIKSTRDPAVPNSVAFGTHRLFESLSLPYPIGKLVRMPRVATDDAYLQKAYEHLLVADKFTGHLSVFMNMTLIPQFPKFKGTEQDLSSIELEGFTQRIIDGVYHVYRDGQEVTTQEVIDEYEKRIHAEIQEAKDEFQERFKQMEKQMPAPKKPD